MMLCPIVKDECIEEECRMWNPREEECAVALLGEGVKEISEAMRNSEAQEVK